GHVGHARAGDIGRGARRDVLPGQRQPPLARMPQAHDGAQRGGLARTVAAQQHGELVGRYDEVHAVEDVVRADVRMHTLERQQRIAHAASLSSGLTPRYACCTTGEAITAAGSPSATSSPLCSTMMRSESSRTTSILCSTSKMVLVLSALSWRIRFRITGTSSTLMPAVGSSN